MRRFLVTSLVAALAALAAVSPAAAQSNSRAFAAVCEAQGGSFLSAGVLACYRPAGGFSERELATQQTVCERAHGGTFVRPLSFLTVCVVP